MRLHFFISIFMLLIFSCGGPSKVDQMKEKVGVKANVDPTSNWKDNHGIGPVKAFTLPDQIDQSLAAKGQEIYEGKCTACHKAEKKFIGPAPKGILEKRTPAWIMNMILNPEEMVQKDPIAKQLLIEFNGSPMANQNLTEDEARAVLEYFRTL